ncbi:vacuolar protein sorting-associated protein [Naegleria gruberi]|uniref:Vacuolar protein sorting-associated protein 35 n=1 Tax=Naegleria gruberi TaxID=5762 RepID=D2VNG9_NAEGR|nr:vacuolar protein sorting-associated protein [Naegleria gruberi]EFC41731.1 vacuolar protein sorting-associated protein [Naegleria gruberi]|eukprot:XP_002674475.1 vacuolar protein sorting-associated protein [Naegleria gruberi strain NEG-M]
MQVFDQLGRLTTFFRGEENMQDLYIRVQHTPSIVPRLYLMATIGSIYIKSKQAPAKDVLKDLVEMCKGVQHPTRGLFLRNYLSQITKDKLPDTGGEYEGTGGNIHDSIAYVLQNFNEMVFLFSRLKNEGPVKERSKREKERLELRILIGFNLVRLSQLDGIKLDIYRDDVLPKILNIIIKSNDQMAQQYLMECLIQVFPDEFHIDTLTQIVTACQELQADVDLKTIYIALMDRLANYARQFPENIPNRDEQNGGANIIDIFLENVEKISDQRMELSDVLAFQISLMNLALQSYPDKIKYVNDVITFCHQQLSTAGDITSTPLLVKLVKKLLLIPIESYKNVLTVLQLEKYGEILELLGFDDRRSIAMDICRCALKHRHKVTNVDEIRGLFELIKPLLKDEEDTTDVDEEDFEEEQNLVARLIHICDSEDTDMLFKVYSTARKAFGQGGVKRIQYTLTPLVFSYLSLAKRIFNAKDREEKAIKEDKVFQYVIEILEVLANQQSDMALKLYLQSAICADLCKLETIVFELLSQAFMLYEEQDSKIQLEYFIMIINALRQMKNIGNENYDTLSTKTCQYSSRLLLKPNQCKAAFMCSHLFWPMEHNESLQNADKSLECLIWSLKIVKSCMADQKIALFIEILNVHLYQFINNNEKVTVDYLNDLIDVINSNIGSSEEEFGVAGAATENQNETKTVAPIATFYRNTLEYIKLLKSGNSKFESITL